MRGWNTVSQAPGIVGGRWMHGHEMVSDPNSSRPRKRQLEVDGVMSARAVDEVDIASCATIAYSSEDPDHPAEHLLDGRSGPGATRWISARPDVIEQIVVEFDRPQTISRLAYEGEEGVREGTQGG